MTNDVNDLLFTRTIATRWFETKEGVVDTGNSYMANMNRNTAYVYLGLVQSQTVLTVDVSDKTPWSYGQSITCLSRATFGKDSEAAVAKRRPNCFKYGSAGDQPWRAETKSMVYLADNSNNFMHWWLASSVPAPADKVQHREIIAKVRNTFSDSKEGPRSKTYWPDLSTRAAQRDIVLLLNEALSEAQTTRDHGTIPIVSMEDVAHTLGM